MILNSEVGTPINHKGKGGKGVDHGLPVLSLDLKTEVGRRCFITVRKRKRKGLQSSRVVPRLEYKVNLRFSVTLDHEVKVPFHSQPDPPLDLNM